MRGHRNRERKEQEPSHHPLSISLGGTELKPLSLQWPGEAPPDDEEDVMDKDGLFDALAESLGDGVTCWAVHGIRSFQIIGFGIRLIAGGGVV